MRALCSQDLLGQMSRIREKATESEAVVRNITKEIQVLDLAKKNLILSMTTLKRLQMLGTYIYSFADPVLPLRPRFFHVVNALGQLEDQIKERKYHDIVQSLAVRRSYLIANERSADTYYRQSNRLVNRSSHIPPCRG